MHGGVVTQWGAFKPVRVKTDVEVARESAIHLGYPAAHFVTVTYYL
jgi:uncharacterized membrane protein (UPF0182 family)